MDYFPVFLDLRGRKCLVVGAGEIALHKVQLLLRSGAAVHVVAPRVGGGVAALERAGKVTLDPRGYASTDLEGVALAIAATDDRELNRRVSTEAQARALPVNVVDDPELCGFIVPSIVDRDPIVVAVSTSGSAPALARRLRERLEAVVTEGDAALAALLARHREAVKRAYSDAEARRRFFEGVLDSDVPELCRAGRLEAAERALLARLERALVADDS